MLNNWTNENIMNDIAILKKMILEETDLNKKAYYKQVLNYTEVILKDEQICRFNSIPTEEQMLCNLSSAYTLYGRYYDLITLFHNLSKGPENTLDIIKENYFKIDIGDKDTNLTNEESVTLVHDFFMNTDKIFSKLFSEFYNDKLSGIKFKVKDSTLNIYRYDGICTFVDVLRRNYILVKDTKNLSKAVNLSHECGHAVANLFNPKAVYTKRDEFFSEVASIFFELAFLNDVAYKINSFQSSLLSIEKFDYNLGIMYNLLNHGKILEVWKKNEYKINKKYFNVLKSECDFTKTDILDILNTYIDDDGTYVIGYMVALELLHIYKQNKNEALELLRIILNKQNDDSYSIASTEFGSFSYVKKELDAINNNMNKELLKILRY